VARPASTLDLPLHAYLGGTRSAVLAPTRTVPCVPYHCVGSIPPESGLALKRLEPGSAGQNLRAVRDVWKTMNSQSMRTLAVRPFSVRSGHLQRVADRACSRLQELDHDFLAKQRHTFDVADQRQETSTYPEADGLHLPPPSVQNNRR